MPSPFSHIENCWNKKQLLDSIGQEKYNVSACQGIDGQWIL
jgi:hypothetical protein